MRDDIVESPLKQAGSGTTAQRDRSVTAGPSKTYLEIVSMCDDFPYEPSAALSYYELYLPNDDWPHGYLLSKTVQKMPWTADFHVSHSPQKMVTVLDASNGQNTPSAVNTAFQKLIDLCIEQDCFHLLGGRHSELFAIPGANYGMPVYVERFAAALFGITQRGAHMVAYINTHDEGMKIWVSRRSQHIYTYPGMLDTTVAGGVKSGVPPLQTIIEESDEEASLPAALVRERVRSKGVLTHMSLTGKGFPGEQGLVVPDYIYVYDIELPGDVVPKPHDDEVSNFYCMSVDNVQRALLQEEFKPDSAAVLIDFLVSHSIITPETDKDFVDISMRLHRHLPFRTGPP
ncbi:hypothetical protein BAUCODRAFT_148782 [Baudoinia panamericana UAMH 10762]|uniref:Nudix hydrolase domain-containing protein n=1 Tax=Baudoinia panamericana (strain UAMH 10762) TaxID=717646 RepID=M2N9W9_BAUPA|nr:uncharacterized protein BAUCODRAFT_148782 [Baudoinia panamericana UAMH 10762]EMC95929.1 hypothetical protein BAUCODRAFT_148782 [Baudoinia panamericana UAMH 10762]